MSSSSPEILHLRLRRDLSAPRQLRQALEHVDAIGPIRDDCLLVASELATNALRQAPSHGGGELEVLAEFVPDGVRIVVSDAADPDREDGPRAASTVEPDRIAWRVVQGIARRWGAERYDGHRTWAVLAM